MKRLLIILFLFIGYVGFSQPYTYHLRYDTVKFTTANNSEFVLRSSTRDSTNGILLNIGGGITQFKRIRAISATQFTVGTDTITITGSGGGGGGSGTVTNIATGYGLLGGPITTTGTLVVDTATLGPLWRSQISVPNLIAQNSGTGQQTWWASGDTLYQKRHGNTYGFNWTTASDSTLNGTVDSTVWVPKTTTSQITGAKTFTQNITIQKNGAVPFLDINRMGTTIGENLGGIQFKDNSVTKMYSFLANFGDTGYTIRQGNGVSTKSWNIEDKFGHFSLGFATFSRGYAMDVSHATGNYMADSSLIMGFLRYRWINAGSNVVDSFKVDRGANLVSSGNITAEIDSTGTARNMLYQGANGMIYRAAVPAGGGSSYTFSSGVFESAGAVKVDTSLMATRARLTKSIDSLALLIGGGGVAWGGITGTIASQADLNGLLNSKSAFIKIAVALGSNIKYEVLGRDRTQITATVTLTDGQIRWVPIYVSEAGTLTGVKICQITQGSFTGDNTNSICLWTYSGGTMTKVAESANNEAIWKNASNTFADIAFASSYSASVGVHYISFLFNASSTTTAPGIGALTATTGSGTTDYTNSAKISAFLSSQTSQPSTQAMSGVTSTTSFPWGGIY